MYKEYNRLDELNKEILTEDDEFLQDASLFLQERENKSEFMSSDEIFDEFMEHMRYQDSNEVTAIRDLEYAQNASAESKRRFARLIDAYDKVDDYSWRMVGDYAEAIAFAPSTYIGLVTGGTGKVAAAAGTQAAKLGVRQILKQAVSGATIKSALKGAAVEGAIGAGQGATQTLTRVETGQEEEFTLGRTGTMAIGSAAGAGLLNLGAGTLTTIRANKAGRLLEEAKAAQRNRAKEANELSKQTIKTADKKSVKRIKDKLNALSPDDVATGRKLKDDLSPSNTLEAGFSPELFENIAAATIRVSEKLKLGPNDRITTGIYELLRSEGDELGTKGIKEIQDILKEHNLSMDEFSLVYLAEVSDAGRTLGIQSAITKRLLKDVDDLHQNSISSLSKKEAEDYMDTGKASFLDKVRDFDKLGIGAMTVQPATTIRNTIGGGFRVAIDATTRTMDNAIDVVAGKRPIKNLFDGTADVAKYMISPYEGRVIRTMLEESFPSDVKKLFREAADIEAKANEGKMASFARKMNVLNTQSDNMFKQAVLAASLKRRLSDAGKDFDVLIKEGRTKEIPQDVMKAAIEDAYEFTYQHGFRGQGAGNQFARSFIGLQEKFPIIFSAFMPFPRFVANQLKFQYEHMPVIGMLDIVTAKSGQEAWSQARQKLPKQLTGVAMMTAAYQWRAAQGDDAEWFEIKKGKDTYINGKAIYGPVAPFMVAADIIYRYQNGKVVKDPFKYYSRAFTEATLGSTFRTGLGLAGIETLYNGTINAKGEKQFGDAVGSWLSRYTIPAGVAKDLYSQYDPQSRLVPATATGEENWFDYLYKNATRNLPDIPLYSWTGGKLDVDDYDTPAVSPYQTGPLQAINPIEKQLFGATTLRKSALQKEMSDLGMTWIDLYRPDRDTKIDFYTRQELSRASSDANMNEMLKEYMRSDEYQTEPTREGKIKRLQTRASEIREQAKKRATTRIKAEAKRRGDPYSRVEVSLWDSATKQERAIINQIYQEEYGGRSIDEDKDFTLFEGDRKTNVLVWATAALKKVKGDY